MKLKFGCQDYDKTPTLEERICPECGEKIEVFVIRGKIIEDSQCECGYVMKSKGPEDIILNPFGF